VGVATVATRAAAGRGEIAWDGKLAGGSPAPAGRYVAHLFATSAVGTSDLTAPFTVRR
jgi:hypothetical protein